MFASVSSAWWERPAYTVEQKAEELIKSDFGDRLMVWSEMSKLLFGKGVPAEYLQSYCSKSLGYFSDILDLFNAEIKECLTLGDNAIMKPVEFDVYIQETSRAIKDHRALNPDSSIRRQEVQEVLAKAWVNC